ncbi:hypothetical protein UFOVP898_57 [uncultured Caudovirales phage]|uniref:Uncharacterized protein n=1 Tax=uncultured Caudovirales phage TaxID=2100421 RepID=A0A6J5PY52_9CAUD|nr:hypothetical protein UFOVP898_57 [uncultured Caudovirales phage]CAB4176072.1 hypothetical protein UFOVP985_2 [uncultured Caudovirales phage]CAB4181701.1 hypothetical protein UFOVP1073_55 [uncultured Caudovirales phage]CAB4197571.1 hypothetical protein UFOVP1308_20 [uncultured Caudovirales phage]CAB4210804.1 hypothetical protein UFOVP1423_49 [uncultured Caudovirales phage]
MALLTYNGKLISGLTQNRNCCCATFNCYCYTRFTNYGSTLVERRRVCYRAPYFNGAVWVFPDGQPCVPTNPGGCTVTYIGGIVNVCSCPGAGMNPFRWDFVSTLSQWTACTTIAPPP